MKSAQQHTPQQDFPQAAVPAFACDVARRAVCRWVQAKHASVSFFSLLRGFISDNCSLTPILLCVVSMASFGACSDNQTINQVLTEYFRNIERGAPLKSLDLRRHVPVEWEQVCIGYFPYTPKTVVEEQLQGKVIGRFEIGSDSTWMLLGISGKGEITQMVLDHKLNELLSKHFRAPARHVCVSRQQALLLPVEVDRNIYVNLGSQKQGEMK